MNFSILSAVAIIILLTLWMVSGNKSMATDSLTEKTESTTPELMKVEVIRSTAKAVQRFTKIHGQVEAKRVLWIKAEVEGQIESLKVTEGQRIAKGALLLKLTEGFKPAQVSKAKALLTQRMSELKASRKLLKRGLQSESKYVADQAEVQASKAQLEIAQYQLSHTSISVPFSGVINNQPIEIGDFIEKGQRVALLIDDSELIVSGQVPQTNMAHLQLGQAVDVSLATGENLSGSLSYISSMADTSTRSYRVEVTLANPQHKRFIGLSATLQLPHGDYTGHWVPSSVLGLASNGDLQVKTLDKENRVHTTKVDIIRTEENGFWIDGLTADVTLISIGQNYVSDGEQVEAVDAEDRGES